jgi:hypothetical protein
LNFRAAFRGAPLAFGNCSYIFPGSEGVESELKREVFPELSSMNVLEVTIQNSVDEAENICQITKEKGIKPRCILLVTGELHSRSARFIWQKVFPGATVLVNCIGYHDEVESDSPVPVLRSVPRWIFANIVRHLALLTVGLRIRNLHHRTSKVPANFEALE